jgi:hypothetical protein
LHFVAFFIAPFQLFLNATSGFIRDFFGRYNFFLYFAMHFLGQVASPEQWWIDENGLLQGPQPPISALLSPHHAEPSLGTRRPSGRTARRGPPVAHCLALN